MARHTPLAVVGLDIELDKSQSRLASKTWRSCLRRDESIGDAVDAVDVWPCTR